jgi:hypothetical protein
MENIPLESLKLLKEWSTWLVAIQTAAIGAIGAGFKDVVFIDHCRVLGLASGCGQFAKLLASSVVVLFGVSIISALYLLLALPAIVLRLPAADKTVNIYLMQRSQQDKRSQNPPARRSRPRTASNSCSASRWRGLGWDPCLPPTQTAPPSAELGRR